MDAEKKHFVASGLIINKNKEVLLINHKKLGVWLYPGGHINENETPDQALIRETKEETGLDVEIIGEKDETLSDRENDVSILHNPHFVLCEKINGKEGHYHIDLIYFCRIMDNNADLLYSSGEARDVGFFSKKDLKDINLFPNFRKLLEKVLE